MEMRRSCFVDGRVSGEAVLTIERGSVPGSAFEVPDGYRQGLPGG
jgi:hypothetical protein